MSNSKTALSPLYPILYEEIVRRALDEDLGVAGDLTTDAIVPAEAMATALILARSEGRIAGLDVAAYVFRRLSPQISMEVDLCDGTDAISGARLAVVRGPARPILSAERTALNFLGRLSGIATATRDIVQVVSAYESKVVSTRKTTPGLRALEKYAVRAGGGANHRFGLDDAVLIKDNHRIIAGGAAEAINLVRQNVGHMVKIEVEVDTLEQLKEALEVGVDAVLLDNMSVEDIRRAVSMAKGRALTEASGSISAHNAAAVAATGVDLISLGWITHSAPTLDVSLDFALEV
jgi:nicotinate-nucleotide pyrophosphorylase (carboxylating)